MENADSSFRSSCPTGYWRDRFTLKGIALRQTHTQIAFACASWGDVIAYLLDGAVPWLFPLPSHRITGKCHASSAARFQSKPIHPSEISALFTELHNFLIKAASRSTPCFEPSPDAALFMTSASGIALACAAMTQSSAVLVPVKSRPSSAAGSTLTRESR